MAIEHIAVSVALGVVGFFLTYYTIPLVSDLFIKRGLSGKDMLKPKAPITPESLGVIVGVVYFVLMFLYIPIPLTNLTWTSGVSATFIHPFPHDKFAQYLGGLLAMIAMLFLGFADDVLDIKWRVKIWFPLIASMPLLMVYYLTCDITDVLVPLPLRKLLGMNIIHLGPFYYTYMGAMAVFSTNAINILAGANGVEGVQCVVLALSLMINSSLQLFLHWTSPRAKAMEMSLYYLIPYTGVSFGYLLRNWCPAACFGGDTMVYFSGMVFAVVGIMSNLSKTVLLFMLPQIFNFLFSCPQLFKFVPCPRHRMPKLSPSGNTIEYSSFAFEEVTSLRQKIGRGMIKFLEFFGLVKISKTKNGKWKSCNNLTLLNLILLYFGPMQESNLAWCVCACQIIGSLFAFLVRYGLVHILYNVEI